VGEYVAALFLESPDYIVRTLFFIGAACPYGRTAALFLVRPFKLKGLIFFIGAAQMNYEL
jgi:hypothetical protein